MMSGWGRIWFWTMPLAMVVMGLTFGVAWVLQTYIELVMGLGDMTAQGYMRLWMGITLVAGLFFLGGLLVTVKAVFCLKPAPGPEQAA